MPTRTIPAQDVKDGDLVDVLPLLEDPAARPWTMSPFGSDGQLAEAIDSARVAAECEYATADASEVKDGRVMVYTDQMNFAVPLDHPVVIADQ